MEDILFTMSFIMIPEQIIYLANSKHVSHINMNKAEAKTFSAHNTIILVD